MGDIQFNIVEQVGVLSTSPKGWNKEINRVSWDGAAPKYDIREWSPDHQNMGKGITLTEVELAQLLSLFGNKVSKPKSPTIRKIDLSKSTGEKAKPGKNDNSMFDICASWNKACKHSPAPIREILQSSTIDRVLADKVVIALESGKGDRIESVKDKRMLEAFVSQLMGRRVSVELEEP